MYAPQSIQIYLNRPETVVTLKELLMRKVNIEAWQEIRSNMPVDIYGELTTAFIGLLLEAGKRKLEDRIKNLLQDQLNSNGRVRHFRIMDMLDLLSKMGWKLPFQSNCRSQAPCSLDYEDDRLLTIELWELKNNLLKHSYASNVGLLEVPLVVESQDHTDFLCVDIVLRRPNRVVNAVGQLHNPVGPAIGFTGSPNGYWYYNGSPLPSVLCKDFTTWSVEWLLGSDRAIDQKMVKLDKNRAYEMLKELCSNTSLSGISGSHTPMNLVERKLTRGDMYHINLGKNRVSLRDNPEQLVTCEHFPQGIYKEACKVIQFVLDYYGWTGVFNRIRSLPLSDRSLLLFKISEYASANENGIYKLYAVRMNEAFFGYVEAPTYMFEDETIKLSFGNVKILQMECPSTGHQHHVRVPNDMLSAEDAIVWVNNGIHPNCIARST